jgi:D-alanyl-D-alanine carboxypeptidase
MQKRIKSILLMALLWIFGFISFSQKSPVFPEIPFSDLLQDVIDSELESNNGTGVSVAVVIPGYKTWCGISGMSDPSASQTVQSDMLFGIASIGKNYVAALVLQLAEEGQLNLEDTVDNWLPSFPNIENTITVRQLLNHTSGIFDFVKHPKSPYAISFESLDFSKSWTTEEVIKELVSEPYFPPGEGWHYSTTNYTLLRMIVERITQSELSFELRKRFLNPLNLDHTVFIDANDPFPEDLKIAHNWFDVDGDGNLEDISDKPKEWLSIVPHLTYATAEDLARWSDALFRTRVISESSLDLMLDFHRPTPGEPCSGYGLGVWEWKNELLNGVQAWGHGGWGFGWIAALIYFPENKISMAILMNDNNERCLISIGTSLWNIIKSNL